MREIRGTWRQLWRGEKEVVCVYEVRGDIGRDIGREGGSTQGCMREGVREKLVVEGKDAWDEVIA